MTSPRDAILAAEQHARLLPGDNERFSGWGVMGLPFAGGDVLATRRFPVTSIGPGYTSVWYRDPHGRWVIYADVASEFGCARYFGGDCADAVTCPIVVEWRSEDRLHIEVPLADLVCDLEVEPTVASRAMNLMSSMMPDRAWRSPRVLSPMAKMAGPVLGAGSLGMSGKVSNGQDFIANPRRMWMVKSATLRVGGRDAGPPGPVTPQAHLGDFYIPQRGIVAIGNAAFETFDPARHTIAVRNPDLAAV